MKSDTHELAKNILNRGMLSTLLLALACTPDKPTTPPISVDEPDTAEVVEVETCDVNQVFETNGCLACHDTNADLYGGGINLTIDRLEESLVGVASNSPGCTNEFLVNVEAPESSILLHTVASERYSGTVDSECVPFSMPLGGQNTMTSEDFGCIEQWIESLEPTEVEEPDVTFTAPAFTVLSRVKYLLDGGALTVDELTVGSDSDGELLQEGLADLVDIWMNGEHFHAKRRQFLELHLQQNPSDQNYYNQFRNTRPNSMEPVLEAFSQSIVRTAERIIDNDEDFRSIVTTNTWEVTTITLLALKMADNPMYLKPNGVWPKNHALNDIKYVTMDDKGLYDRDLDSQDWRTVTLLHNPESEDMTTEEDFLDSDNASMLRSVPDGGSIELRAPRIGFFTSPAYYQTWLTNRDNDFRVTINQAMIIATGTIFSPGDSTPLAGGEDAVDTELFPVESTCYGCHKNLDAMRPAFLSNYDNINSRHTETEEDRPRPGFSFKGQSVQVDTLHDWADALAEHPNFAMAWVLKLCQWASSVECTSTNEHVQKLVQGFASGHNMNQLFRDFFTSPLVTLTSNNENTSAPGAQVSVARFGHYCHAMRTRMSDIRVAQGKNSNIPDRLDICRENGPAAILSASLPADQIVRGSVGLHQPRDYTPMVSVAFEGMCSVSAQDIVDTDQKAAFHPEDPDLVLELMNTHLLGFPSGTVQHQRASEMLQRYFYALTATPACESTNDFHAALSSWEPSCGLGLSDEDALRNLWIMSCTSPSMTGVGL